MREDQDVVQDTVVIPHRRLHHTIVAALVNHGAPPEPAGVQAQALTEGDLRGHPSHGLRRLPTLIGRLDAGLIDGAAVPALEWVTEVVARIDGRRGFGPIAAELAVEAITDRAEQTGVALATISNSNHIGMLAPYVERIADRGQVGIVLTTSEALVHAWGGTSAVIGTNPVGIAVPSPRGALSLDMSTAAVSMGKIIDFAATGRALPAGWAVDANGQPTSDATAAIAGGAISPFGGAKGYALGVALEVLVATLTGTSFGADVKGTLDAEYPATKGDLLLAVSLDRLGLTCMTPLVADYLDTVRGSGGEHPVSIPGDRARQLRAERLEHGVPIDRANWEKAVEIEQEALSA